MSTPFNCAEDAWFWFIECEKAKNDGARFIAGMGIERPCNPIDIYIIMTRLVQKRLLRNHHLVTLKNFGNYGYAPSSRIFPANHAFSRIVRGETGRDERTAAIWWKEAMDMMSDELENKGIVSCKKLRSN